MENEPERKAMLRFINSRYETLFCIPDGEQIRMTRACGVSSVRTCTCVSPGDEYHVQVGNEVYHICEFAEYCEEAGVLCAPVNPSPDAMLDYYEIYQIRDVVNVAYSFCPYEEAKGKITRADYRRVYAASYTPHQSMDMIYYRHTCDHRPRKESMRALSVSDVIVIHQAGTVSAWYVDDAGFKKIPDFMEES
jgi:hypothetical protein